MTSIQTQAFWGGEWQSGKGGTFPVFDPSCGSKIADVYDCCQEDVKNAIACASNSFPTWSQTLAKERCEVLVRVRDQLLKNRDEMATLLTKENGKPKAEALGEVGFAASFFEWFGEEARRQYGETIPTMVSNKRYITVRQPAGVAALITPWNFPIGMVGRKVAAALAAGCCCVLKPAEDTPLTALLFAKLCQEAGVPKGVVNVIPCSRSRVQEIGEILCQHRDVQVLSFTGSVRVGQLLYSQCGTTMKKLGMELGGNAPLIVFPSADMEVAVSGTMAAKFRNTGQTCVTANRIFVHEIIHDDFVARLSQAMKTNLHVGPGLEKGVNQGPIINETQLKRLIKIVEETLNQGAKLVMGGKHLEGLFYPPTLLTGVTTTMPAAKEEIFGPVAAIIKFRTEEEVIAMANDTERGLAGYFYSNDITQAWRVAEALQVGMVGVNEGLVSTCEAPFGGVKLSGLGVEGSSHGLDEYSNIKNICFGNIV